MKISARSVGFAGLVGTSLLAGYAAGGCTVSAPLTPLTDSGVASDTGNGADSAVQSAVLSFTPSNISTGLAADAINAANLSVVDIVADTTLNSDSDTTLLLPNTGEGRPEFFVATQSDGTRIGVYVARSWKIEAGVTVHVQGEYVVAFVSASTFDIAGTLDVSSTGDTPGAGGTSPLDTAGVGMGAGGSGNLTTGVAPAGGSLCGIGGAGGFFTGQTAAKLGLAYSVPSLIPLPGGSTGGVGVAASGAGGGGVQITANTTFTLEAGAIVSANGGGGSPSATVTGGGSIPVGAGGGSGGSILIEAPTVTISGILAANGGGGGGNSGATVFGQDGQSSTTPATGSGTGVGLGGNGSGGATTAGTAGANGTVGSIAPGGGGGGSGAIRINTTSGAASLTSATMSPASSTACVSQGTIAAQ